MRDIISAKPTWTLARLGTLAEVSTTGLFQPTETNNDIFDVQVLKSGNSLPHICGLLALIEDQSATTDSII